MISPQELAVLPSALEPVYEQLARPYDDTPVWEQRVCANWSRLALPIVRSMVADESAVNIIYGYQATETDLGQMRSNVHFRLVAGFGSETDPLLIDGTWQQFSRASRAVKARVPRILIAHASQVDELLATADIDAAHWPHWNFQASGTNYRFKQYTPLG